MVCSDRAAKRGRGARRDAVDKLHVALKLIQLLHERRFINLRIVADELDVSIRTAQRYLNELARMPCVISQENSHTYALNPDYKLRSATVSHEQNAMLRGNVPGMGEIKHSLCLLCNTENDFRRKEGIFEVSRNIVENNYRLQTLIKRIKSSLLKGKCIFH